MQEKPKRKRYKCAIFNLEFFIRDRKLLTISFGTIKDNELQCLLRYPHEDYGNGDPAHFSNLLDIYVGGKDPHFDTALRMHGTPFQIAIWKACMQIPFGQTRSYRELAAMAGYPRAVRAAGSALSKNPLPLIVPCHRVIRSDGSPGAFTGGRDLKIVLINHEKGLI